MNSLSCDICGGKLVVRSGGVAICENCGMEHSKERMQEKLQEAKVDIPVDSVSDADITPTVDNPRSVDDWMKMGTEASQAGNYKEAYECFTKVTEVEPDNWRAIYEKGKAGAWQSSLGNIRTAEIEQGVAAALDIIDASDMDEESIVAIKNEFALEVFNVNRAITNLMHKKLIELKDKYFAVHWYQMWDTLHRYITDADKLEYAVSLIEGYNDELSVNNVIIFKMMICVDIKYACQPIQYWLDYSQASMGYLGLSAVEKQNLIKKYWALVDEIRVRKPEFAKEKELWPDPFEPGAHKPEDVFAYWQKVNDELQAQKNRKERFEKYWEEHSEEKQKPLDRNEAINSELSELRDKLSPLDNEISSIVNEPAKELPDAVKLEEIKQQQLALIEQKTSIGRFDDKKQRKQLQKQIDSLRSEIDSLTESVDRQRKALQADSSARSASSEDESEQIIQRIA